MTSDKKAKANRRNALMSTGPRTPEGKDAVRLNALKPVSFPRRSSCRGKTGRPGGAGRTPEG